MNTGDTFELSDGTALQVVGRSKRDGAFFVEPVANALEATNRHKGFLDDEQPLDLPDFNFEGQGDVAESDGDQANEPLEMPSMF